MRQCSAKAYAMCPIRHMCGPIDEATFTDCSGCAAFNKQVEDKPMTNADRIRAMSDEELAKYLFDVKQGNFTIDCCDDRFCDTQNCRHDCAKAAIKWLQQPVKEKKR